MFYPPISGGFFSYPRPQDTPANQPPLRLAAVKNEISGVYQTGRKLFILRRRSPWIFFNSAIEVLQTLVVALGAGLGVWGGVNLLEGYGSDNPGSNAHVP